MKSVSTRPLQIGPREVHKILTYTPREGRIVKSVEHVRPLNPDVTLSKLHRREACHLRDLQCPMLLILMPARPLREMYHHSMDLHKSLNPRVKLP